MNRGRISLIKILIVVAIISILAALVIPAIQAMKDRTKQAQEQNEGLLKVDYLVLGEGKLEKVEYVFDGQQYTLVHFQNGSVARMVGVNSIGFEKGDRIRISQKRLGAGTEYEKLEPSYKISLLRAEAK